MSFWIRDPVAVVVSRNQILEDGPSFRQADLDGIGVNAGHGRNMHGTACRIIVELAPDVVDVDRVDAVRAICKLGLDCLRMKRVSNQTDPNSSKTIATLAPFREWGLVRGQYHLCARERCSRCSRRQQTMWRLWYLFLRKLVEYFGRSNEQVE